MTPDTGADNGKSPRANDREWSPEHAAVPPAAAGQRDGFRELLRKAITFGRVEVRGITPIPVKERTVTRTVNIFTLWWSMSTNILA